jgi:hypothetical protein
VSADDASDVLDSQSQATILNETVEIAEVDLNAALPNEETRRFSRLRRSLRKVTYAVAGLVAAVGTGVTVNLLTAPEAALTLTQRLQPILDKLVAYFL